MRTKGKKKADYLEKISEVDPTSSAMQEDLSRLGDEFQVAIRTDPKYSLMIDPEGKYNFSQKDKDFIQWMIQYKNVQFVSTIMMNIPIEEGVEMYKRYDVQTEIKRLNMAYYARRFATKMADLEQLGGYLTSGLTDENIPVADRWSAKEKLTATKMLISLNMMKGKAFDSPQVVEVVEIQKDLDKLSPNELKQLIEYTADEDPEKDKLIQVIDPNGDLTMEELKNLRTMPLEELKKLAATIVGAIDEEESEDEEDEE